MVTEGTPIAPIASVTLYDSPRCKRTFFCECAKNERAPASGLEAKESKDSSRARSGYSTDMVGAKINRTEDDWFLVVACEREEARMEAKRSERGIKSM